jgi:predicted GIY-YIG superfamily endonuclease
MFDEPRIIKANWLVFLEDSLRAILRSPTLAFTNMKPSDIPEITGVYLITVGDEPYYVGRTTNLRSRIYTQHLMGNADTSTFKKGLVDSGECLNLQATKEFLRQNAVLRWIEEKDMRTRGALEGYFTGVLFPKYGIAEEH